MHESREPHNMWRELRSWPMSVQIGVAAVGLGSIVLAFAVPAIVDRGDAGDPARPEGELPTAADIPETSEAPAAEDGNLPEGVSVYDGEPLWTHRPDEEASAVAHVDQGTLVRSEESLRLITDEETVWEHTWEEFAPEIGVAGEVVVISTDGDGDAPWPGRQETVAFDLDTGEEVWRDEDASFVTVFSDAVLMSECGGGQDERIGDCTLYARDPQTLSTLWSTPTYASVQALSSSDWSGEPLPEPLLVESFPTGHASRTVSALGPGGEELVAIRTQSGAVAAAAERMLLVHDDYDDNPADGCTAVVQGHRFGEDEPAWEIETQTRKSADLRSCGSLPSTAVRDGRLPLTIDGVPAVVDTTNGETVWTAPDEGQAYTLSEDAGTLVAVDWESEEDNLVAYDIESGEVLWRSSAAVEASTRAKAIGSTLWIYGSSSIWGWSDLNVTAYNLDTGEGVALPGSVSSFSPEQIVMSDGETDETQFTAWPIELWP